MKHRITPGAELRALKARFDLWRQNRKKGSARLPEELWAAAAQVAQTEGIHRTASTLRLNHTDLKKRVLGSDAPKPVRGRRRGGGHSSQPATFVQLDMPASNSDHQKRQLVIELSGPHGNRMRVEAVESAKVDLVGLAQAFWSRGS